MVASPAGEKRALKYSPGERVVISGPITKSVMRTAGISAGTTRRNRFQANRSGDAVDSQLAAIR
ncbi:MAG: hypothetical protein BWX50_01265 [Euryarchaeota archaeon ADurb.Bin009]|nr:MAG: hypothetical protein BWX50_01265 [Euryarchaeota archaeon ADurb.Bin009]